MSGRRLPAAGEALAPARRVDERIGRVKMERLGVFPRAAPLLPPAPEVRPSAERRQHGRIERVRRQIADSQGLIGDPWVALSTLAQMERAGTITPRQRRAGDAFHDCFRRAGLDSLKAAPLVRVGAGAADWHNGNEAARRRIAAAIRCLGGDATILASCAWHVLGLEWSLREWAAKSLGGKVDRASGVVIATLALLEPHFDP